MILQHLNFNKNKVKCNKILSEVSPNELQMTHKTKNKDNKEVLDKLTLVDSTS
jgi:hypothetical protein